MFYCFAGGLIDVMSSYSFSIIKAMSMMCVSKGEIGKVNAVLSAIENLLPVVGVQGYVSLWNVRVTDRIYASITHFKSRET